MSSITRKELIESLQNPFYQYATFNLEVAQSEGERTSKIRPGEINGK